MIKAAILGFGVVGSGVYEILKQNADGVFKQTSKEVEVKYILDIRDFDSHPDSHLFTKNFDDILNDSEVRVIAEVMGGVEPAYTYTKAALTAGKNVVTSNKELVAKHGTELLAIAKEYNVNYMFEASVGGGIPIIRPLYTCLAANNIDEIYGILNGTTNYILTQMFEHGQSFDDALLDAQCLGYAEKNPTADVDGIDACRKIAILSSLASGKFVDSEKILTEGISKITKTDVKAADKLGYVIKLIGYAKFEGEKVFCRVSPMLVPKESMLSKVSDVFNAILVNASFLGEAMFYGKGAGKLPTASAVCADIIDCVKHVDINRSITWHKAEKDFLIPASDTLNKYFVRTKDSSLADKFKNASICESDNGEIIFTTEKMLEKDFIELASGKCEYIRIMC